MEAYSASATATEMKNTTDSLVKLHGLAAPDNATQVNININGTKQLELACAFCTYVTLKAMAGTTSVCTEYTGNWSSICASSHESG